MLVDARADALVAEQRCWWQQALPPPPRSVGAHSAANLIIDRRAMLLNLSTSLARHILVTTADASSVELSVVMVAIRAVPVAGTTRRLDQQLASSGKLVKG